MKKTLFNNGWKFSKVGSGILGSHITGFAEGKLVTLPHDAMMEEEKKADCPNLYCTGYYPGGVYRYTKRFMVPAEWKNKTVIVEFEGAYMSAMVYLNGDHLLTHNNGYANFYVNLDQRLLYGEENELEVFVNNSAEPNSRWYTGSGIYRNVNLILGNLLHVKTDGIKITTPEISGNIAVVVVEAQLCNLENRNQKVKLVTRIYDSDNHLAAEESTPAMVCRNADGRLRQRITMIGPRLWDCDNPELYRCEIDLQTEEGFADHETVKFGIRKLSLDAQNGFAVNGKEMKLRGACIHHDNGIIGACTLQKAEERRCRLLKEAGFNCIRSAHNPICKELLDACDSIGMFVVDELADMWNHPKNINDYAMFFQNNWEEDIRMMVAKDFNHPSVIMYSTGNEIQEAGTSGGAQMNQKICEKIRSLDSTRYITSAFNSLLASIDYKMEISAALRQEMSDGNKELNDLMGERDDVASEDFIGKAQIHPIMTEKIDEYMASLDIAGYNYMTVRHEMDRESRPNRVIIGSETFPSEIDRLWDIVKRNKYVIGDMTWTGMDHLGESNLVSLWYEGDDSGILKHGAYVGDVDLIGHRKPISYYREIVYGMRKEPFIAVERPGRFGQVIHKSNWAFEDSVESWSWVGFEGCPVMVNVYGDGEEAELIVNGISQGRKVIGQAEKYKVSFQTVYETGKIEALLYRAGKICGRHALETVDSLKELYAEADRTELQADG
ncbi:MAG: glycoside hydrolase family 2 protein [Ruminococcus flavefaciens]|nr:glycoside hydrolase family 2 protein [Ruminococcus flavefaciens]